MMEWQPNETEKKRAHTCEFFVFFFFASTWWQRLSMIKQIYCTLFDIRIRNFSLESKVRCSWYLCANISVGIQLGKNQIPNKVYVTTFIFVLVGFLNTHTHTHITLTTYDDGKIVMTDKMRNFMQNDEHTPLRARILLSFRFRNLNVHISRTMK